MRAIKIRTNPPNSRNLLSITHVYLMDERNGWFSRDAVYIMVSENPGCVQVGLYPFSNVVSEHTERGVPYIRSSPLGSFSDSLLSLPRG